MKHTEGAWTIDQEGKDTWRHWKAGADPVVFSSISETSIVFHEPMDIERITGILAREFNTDIIIIEGHKKGQYPKVAVGKIRPLSGTVMRNPDLKKLLRYIERGVMVERVAQALPGIDCHKCGLDCERLAEAIADGKKKLSDCRELPNEDVTIIVGDKRIRLGRFATEVAVKTVRGVLSSLKGYEPGKDVEIRLRAKRAISKKGRRRG